jgi:hypothetical protein
MLNSEQTQWLLKCAQRAKHIPNDAIVLLLRAGYANYNDNDSLRITAEGLEYLRTRAGP